METRSRRTTSSHQGQGGPTLASIVEVLEYHGEAVDGLPIYGLKYRLKAVVSSILTVLGSVGVGLLTICVSDTPLTQSNSPQQTSGSKRALAVLGEQVRILEANILRPLWECTELPPVLVSALDDLTESVC